MQTECEFLKQSKEAQIAWAAGFFEGEGCFVYSQTTRNRRSFQRRAVLANTDLEALRNFNAAVGLGKIGAKPRSRTKARAHWKPCWQWVCSHREELAALIEMFQPYLSTRRLEKANQILLNPAGKPGGIFTDKCKYGHARTPENTYVHEKTGTRHCRACSRRRGLEHYRANRSYWQARYQKSKQHG